MDLEMLSKLIGTVERLSSENVKLSNRVSYLENRFKAAGLNKNMKLCKMTEPSMNVNVKQKPQQERPIAISELTNALELILSDGRIVIENLDQLNVMNVRGGAYINLLLIEDSSDKTNNITLDLRVKDSHIANLIVRKVGEKLSEVKYYNFISPNFYSINLGEIIAQCTDNK
jgi:hypothetical protein